MLTKACPCGSRGAEERHRRGVCRGQLAALPHPLHGQPAHPSAQARPTRCGHHGAHHLPAIVSRRGPRPTGPNGGTTQGALSPGGGAAGGRRAGDPGLHGLPSVPLAEAVVQQPTGTAEPRDTAPQSLPPKGDVVGIFPNRLSARRRAGGVLAKQHDEWAAARPKGKSGGTEFAQRLLCPTAIITLLLNHFDAQFGSPNIHYVQQRVRERRLSRSERPLAHVRFRRYCRPAGGPRNRFPQRVVPIWIPVNPGCAMRR